ncbi:MAG: hypothetical protein AB1668_04225 [Nanoarchaeota archaeon]
MKEVSNKVILILLVVAITITLAGTIISVSKLKGVGGRLGITFAAQGNATGTSTITVQSVTSITNQVSTVAFGSGYVNSSCTSCTIMTDTKGIQPGNESCCVSFNNATASFLIENTGNVPLFLNFSCAPGSETTSCQAADMIGGTNPVFQFRTKNASDATNNSADSFVDTAYSCGTASANTGYNYSSFTNLDSTTNFHLCGANGSKYYFNHQAINNSVVIELKAVIPDNANAGSQRTATLTFNGESSG